MCICVLPCTRTRPHQRVRDLFSTTATIAKAAWDCAKQQRNNKQPVARPLLPVSSFFSSTKEVYALNCLSMPQSANSRNLSQQGTA